MASSRIQLCGAEAASPRKAVHPRPLLGVLLLAAGAAALVGLSSSAGGSSPSSFVAGRPQPRRPLRDNVGTATIGRRAGEALTGKEEMSDFDKLVDRFSTRGGAILVTVLGIFGSFALEKFFEVGVDSTTAGIWVSAVLFLATLVWTSQYLFRVANKSTTYADQLANYEQEVMMRRLQELDEEEIAALCAEVGVSQEDIEECVGDKRAALTQKQKVLELFKNSALPADPRASLGGP